MTSQRGHVWTGANDELRLSQPTSDPHIHEVGQSGLRIHSGTPANTETNFDFRPVKVRGVRTRPGLYHDIVKSHFIAVRWLSDIQDKLQSSNWEVTIDAPESHEHQAENLRLRVSNAIDRMEPDFDQLIPQIVKCAAIGFSLFEPVFRKTGEIKKLAQRRQHAVEKWIWDDQVRTLEGVELTRGDHSRYVLEGEQMALARWRPDGDDPEGNAQLRSVVRLIEAHRLLRRIQMVAVERKGAGYAQAEGDADAGATSGEIKKVEEALRQMLATDNPYVVLPPGWRLNLVSPQGQTPKFDEQIQQLVTYTAIGLGAEHVLVGMGDVGTYNLQESKQDEADSKLPAYAGVIERFFNSHTTHTPYRGIIPRMVDYMGGPVAGVYPQLRRIPPKEKADHDTILKAAEAGLIRWTDDDEDNLREDMGLEPIDETQEVRDIGTESGDGGGGFSLSTTGCDCCSGDGPDAQNHSLAGLTLADINVSRIERWLEAGENALGNELRDVGREHRTSAVQLLRGETSRRRVDEVIDRLHSRYKDNYENAIRGEIKRMVVRGNATVLTEMGVLPNLPQIPADEDEAVRRYALPTDEFEDLVDGVAARIARHATNLTESYIEDRMMEETEEAVRDREEPDIPSTGAYANMAGTYISEPFNFGRDQVAQKIKNEAAARGYPEVIVAERTSVLDGNTCDKCEELHGRRFVVGSDAYQRHLPPAKCDGGRRCRCMMQYIRADESGFEDILDEVMPEWRQETMLAHNDGQPTMHDVVAIVEELYAS